MSEETKPWWEVTGGAPPPWPTYNDEGGKSLLATWMEDQLAEAHEELYGDEPEIIGLLTSEQALLLEAFESKNWTGVAARLRDAAATRAFVCVVADLIELGAMGHKAKLLWDTGEFADGYTHLRRRDDIVTIRDWLVIDHVLRRTYSEIGGKKIEWMASWLTAVLRGTEPGKADEQLHDKRIDYIKNLKASLRKDGVARTGSALARLVHSVMTAVVIDEDESARLKSAG
ncbi:hypothetical protein [Rhizobium bangladeshense]|uniref:hypothetical protein n=1 Tax=Rhizobium bangladeshense TaxID=1138189 RepID=UPI001C83A7F7|nr:hypothetical protein [Rhizobium bangladeshense]MBX4889667.1 hypothetical protein [Rhizobium bangladeshense]